MKKEVAEAVATLVGGTIGAGILGIPYVVAKSGLLTGIVDIILIGAAILVVNLYMGKIVLRTKMTPAMVGMLRACLAAWSFW